MNQDARSTCRAIVLVITPFVFFKMALTCRDNFVFVKNVMTFKTCPLARIGPKSVNLPFSVTQGQLVGAKRINPAKIVAAKVFD